MAGLVGSSEGTWHHTSILASLMPAAWCLLLEALLQMFGGIQAGLSILFTSIWDLP